MVETDTVDQVDDDTVLVDDDTVLVDDDTVLVDDDTVLYKPETEQVVGDSEMTEQDIDMSVEQKTTDSIRPLLSSKSPMSDDPIDSGNSPDPKDLVRMDSDNSREIKPSTNPTPTAANLTPAADSTPAVPSPTADSTPAVPSPTREVRIPKHTLLNAGNSRFDTNQSYYLLYPHVEKPVIVLDWDDTMFPSAAVCKDDIITTTIKVAQRFGTELETYETAAILCIRELVRAARRVVIVTNAEQGWVELCCNRYVKRLGAYIREQGIQVISARSRFEQEYPDACDSWKRRAFQCILNGTIQNGTIHPVQESDSKQTTSKHIISIGDSLAERAAAAQLADSKDDIYLVKNLKCNDAPSIKLMTHQFAYITRIIDSIASFPMNLDLKLSS
jgi:hypothetical protein